MASSRVLAWLQHAPEHRFDAYLQGGLQLVVLLLELLHLRLPVVLTQPVPSLACSQSQHRQGRHVIVAGLVSDIH